MIGLRKGGSKETPFGAYLILSFHAHRSDLKQAILKSPQVQPDSLAYRMS